MISVIIPVYNVEKYLEECLDSVLRQSYQDFEVLLIDDGSKDGSGKICDAYASKDSRFSVIHKENGGVSSARNLGLKKAKGEYIAFVDSDDIIADDYLEKLYQGILVGDADVCLCKYSRLVDDVLIPQVEKGFKTYINNKGIDAYFDQFLSHFVIVLCEDDASCWQGSTCRMRFRKSSFSYPLQEDISIHEDLIYVLRNFSAAKRVNVVDESLYYYRANETSAMSNYRKNFLANQQAFLREFEDILRGLNLSDKRKTEDTISGHRAFFVAFLLWNEIRFRNQLEDFRGNIERIKRNEVYDYLTLKNIMKIKHVVKKIKALGLWLLIKAKLYKLM